MFENFYVNRTAVNLMSNTDEKLPKFSNNDWQLINSVVKVSYFLEY